MRDNIFTTTYYMLGNILLHGKCGKRFNKRNLELYVRLNVLLLADVFENFRSICSRIYVLDTAHYIPAPSLA